MKNILDSAIKYVEFGEWEDEASQDFSRVFLLFQKNILNYAHSAEKKFAIFVVFLDNRGASETCNLGCLTTVKVFPVIIYFKKLEFLLIIFILLFSSLCERHFIQ